MAVRLVTDSTANLPEDICRAMDITVVPLTVFFGEQGYREGIDLDSAAFFAKLAQAPALPRTAQPAPADFTAVYDRLLAEGHDVLSVHISAALSGTYNSAVLGRAECSAPQRVTVLDSRSTAMCMGIAVIEGARAARAGQGLSEVAAAVRAALGRTELLLFVDTLEYLQRGGRIGAARALLGGLLSVKPLLTLREGTVQPAGQVRTRARALERLRQWAAAHDQVRAFCVLHTQSPADAQVLYEELRARHPTADAYLTEAGPVIATHVGPGGVGLVLSS